MKSYPIISEEYISRVVVLKKGLKMFKIVIANDSNWKLEYLKIKDTKIVDRQIIFKLIESKESIRGLKGVSL